MLIAITLMLAVALPSFMAWRWLLLRRNYYRRFEELKAPDVPISPESLAVSESLNAERKAAWAQIATLHETANELQTRYHFFMAMTACALFLGFAALAASLTFVAENGPNAGAFAAFDFACFAFALLAFLIGSKANPRWIAARAATELLRQWAAVDDFLLGTTRSETRDSAFAAAKASMRCATVEEISALWLKRKDELRRAFAKAGGIDSARMRAYLKHRPLRQLNWFHASQHRLQSQGELRSRILAILFAVATMLALAKVLAVADFAPEWLHEGAHMIAFALLLTVGTSATLTALYFNQNARSLRHRYGMQEQQIRRWLEAAVNHFELNRTSEEVRKLDATAFEHVLEFEDLLIVELIDWMNITARDKIELAP